MRKFTSFAGKKIKPCGGGGGAFCLNRPLSEICHWAYGIPAQLSASPSVWHVPIFAVSFSIIVYRLAHFVGFHRRAWLSRQPLYYWRPSSHCFGMVGRIHAKFALHWPVEPVVGV